MTVRGTTTPQERVFGALPYLLPLIQVMVFSGPFVAMVPAAAIILQPLMPLVLLYFTVPFLGLAIFFGLFMLVVRNEALPHFIRFNSLQALVIGISLTIAEVLFFQVLGPVFGFAMGPNLAVSVAGPSAFLVETLFNFLFLGVFAASTYSIVQVLRGHYPEIPTISDVVYMQVR